MLPSVECPYCHHPAMSVWKRLVLGPVWEVTCQACGGRVGTPWWGIYFLIPFFAAILLAAFIDSALIAGAVWVVGAALMVWRSYRYVRLVPK
jgi:hypothetical protein